MGGQGSKQPEKEPEFAPTKSRSLLDRVIRDRQSHILNFGATEGPNLFVDDDVTPDPDSSSYSDSEYTSNDDDSTSIDSGDISPRPKSILRSRSGSTKSKQSDKKVSVQFGDEDVPVMKKKRRPVTPHFAHGVLRRVPSDESTGSELILNSAESSPYSPSEKKQFSFERPSWHQTPKPDPSLQQMKELDDCRPIHRRSNTLSSAFLFHSLDSPDDEMMTWGVSIAILKLIEECSRKPQFILRYFEPKVDQHLKLSMHKPRAFIDTPSVDEIFAFMDALFKKAQLSPECNIITLVYVKRLLDRTNLTLRASNWRHILFGATLLASKTWDDMSMINVDFSVVCPMFTIQQINHMELKYLQFLEWDVTIFGDEYTKWHFYLRDLYEEHFGPQNTIVYNLKPRFLEDCAVEHSRRSVPPSRALSAPPTPRRSRSDMEQITCQCPMHIHR